MRPGAIIVMPSDTVYGLMARASDREAVGRLYRLKNRESKPGTLIAADIDQLVALGIKKRYLQPVSGYWPGAVSVIIPVSDPALNYLHQDKGSLAVRLPDNTELVKLLSRTGPLLTSSANPPGQPPAATIEEARAYFGNEVDLYVDGGLIKDRLPSTIIRVIDDAIEVIRPGAVTIQE